jgi:hypothetical protein
MTVTIFSDLRVQFVLILVSIPFVMMAVIALTVAFERLTGDSTASQSTTRTGRSESGTTSLPAADGILDHATDGTRREPTRGSPPNKVRVGSPSGKRDNRCHFRRVKKVASV